MLVKFGFQDRDDACSTPGHAHAGFTEAALASAEELCRRRGLRLTPIRRRILELIWQKHEPIGAYGLLDQLNQDGRRAMPPTVYRALEFLVAHGLVHRLATLNAFVGCAHPGHDHQGQFLICRDCRQVVEIESTDAGRALRHEAEVLGFCVEAQSVELTGLCQECGSQAR